MIAVLGMIGIVVLSAIKVAVPSVLEHLTGVSVGALAGVLTIKPSSISSEKTEDKK